MSIFLRLGKLFQKFFEPFPQDGFFKKPVPSRPGSRPTGRDTGSSQPCAEGRTFLSLQSSRCFVIFNILYWKTIFFLLKGSFWPPRTTAEAEGEVTWLIIAAQVHLYFLLSYFFTFLLTSLHSSKHSPGVRFSFRRQWLLCEKFLEFVSANLILPILSRLNELPISLFY